jgi:hypothetical protein
LKNEQNETVYFLVHTRGLTNRLDDAGLNNAAHREVVIELLTWFSARHVAVWPSVATLAKTLPHSEATIRRALEMATVLGLLARKSRAGHGQFYFEVTPRLWTILGLPDTHKKAVDSLRYAMKLAEEQLPRPLTDEEKQAVAAAIDDGRALEAVAEAVSTAVWQATTFDDDEDDEDESEAA